MENENKEIKEKKRYKLNGKIKKFDEKLYTKYDIPARELVKEKFGDLIEDNPDIYAEDMIFKDPKCKFKYLELQVCATWTQEKYPYELPFVYERKGHMDEDTLFMLFNQSLSRVMVFSIKGLKEKPKRLKKYSRYWIYEVPWSCVMQTYTHLLSMDDIYLYQL